MSGTNIQMSPDCPVTGDTGYGPSSSSLALKRTIDVVLATLGLVLLAPLGVLIAVAVRLGSPGPALFRQIRVGRHGVPFEMLKFRTMVDGAHDGRPALEALNGSTGLFKLRDDPRLTRVGCVLRRASLDELPQLINVFRGEMSLVGPRPLVAEEDRLVLGAYRDRLKLVPGMTGPWQTLGPIRPPIEEMVELDYRYGENWSLWTDAKILLRTVWHVVRLRGY